MSRVYMPIASTSNAGFQNASVTPSSLAMGSSLPNGALVPQQTQPQRQKHASLPASTVPAPDWRYEMRREAQEIVPNLFIGPYQSCRSLPYMQGLGLTHVLCIADAREAHLVKPRFPDSFNYKVLEIRDAQDQNLIRIFPEAKAFIDEALAVGGRILVHCGDGISRSPAIVTAYVMTAHNMTHDDAFQYVQARRFCISPNANFQHQIEAYQHIYEATLQIANDPLINARSNAQVRRKRSDSDDEGDHGGDAEMQDGDDMLMSTSERPMHSYRNVHPKLEPPGSDAQMGT